MTVKYKTSIHKLSHLSGHYLEVSEAVIEKLGGLKMRLICTLNKSLSFQCGMVALGEGKAYILLNAAKMKELEAREGAKVEVELKADDSTYGMEVPKELSEVFKQDKEAKKRFDKLPPGKRRYIIYYISQVKSTQLRIDRAIMLMTNLKSLPVGKETFKGLLTKI